MSMSKKRTLARLASSSGLYDKKYALNSSSSMSANCVTPCMALLPETQPETDASDRHRPHPSPVIQHRKNETHLPPAARSRSLRASTLTNVFLNFFNAVSSSVSVG